MSLKERLTSGEALVGALVQLPSPGLIELCAYAGFELVLVDAEHGAIDPAEAEQLVRAAEASGIGSLIRVPDGEASTIGRFLDCGADGVVVPHVQSGEKARAVVQAAHFPPVGDRSLGRSRALAYGAHGDLLATAGSRHQTTIVGVMIEDRAGVESLSEIVSVPEVDIVLLGPTDLALSGGYAGGATDAELISTVADAIARIVDAGKLAAIGVADAEAATNRLEQGIRLLVINVADLLMQGSRSFLQFRTARQ